MRSVSRIGAAPPEGRNYRCGLARSPRGDLRSLGESHTPLKAAQMAARAQLPRPERGG
jgi:hypothetical protein